MADDRDVEIRIGASADEALSKIAQVRAALAGLSEPVRGLDGHLSRLRGTFAAALPAAQLSDPTQRAAAGENGDLAVEEKRQTLNRMAELEARHRAEQLRLDQQAIAEQQEIWMRSFGAIEGAFDSQLRSLLAGTESWHQAMLRISGDLIIKMIEAAVRWTAEWLANEARIVVTHLVSESAMTTATTAGVAARTAAQETGAASGLMANIANALKNIAVDAGQAFGGVFAFLAPTVGPAAAGPAAAAQASVMSAAVFDVGTDYVMRGGLALIHPGESIIPAARGSGPFTGVGAGATVHAPVNINMSALDAQSVRRFFNDNSHHMLRAINDAVKRGAHLGLRGVR